MFSHNVCLNFSQPFFPTTLSNSSNHIFQLNHTFELVCLSMLMVIGNPEFYLANTKISFQRKTKVNGIEDGVGNTGYEGDGFSYNPIDTSPASRSGVSPIVVAISAVIGILLLIILAVVLIRYRRNKELKAISVTQRPSGANTNGGGRRTTDTLLSAASRGSSFAATNGSIRSRKSSHPNGNGSLGNTLLMPSPHSKNNGLIYDPDRYGN